MNNLTDKVKQKIVTGQVAIAALETVLWLIALRSAVKAGGTPNQITFRMLFALASPTIYIILTGMSGCSKTDKSSKVAPVTQIQN
tara:strand:- start:266 stop:520 length:255 start_codon:yes stop_codon:yes gene_type:complete